MIINLRQESESDFTAVFDLIQKAFLNAEYSDNNEHFLVDKLRKSEAFIPELSIVAECDNQLVGHIILSKIRIKNEDKSYPSLALAPVSVLPDFQGKGIGGKLILHSHEIAKDLGYKSVVLLGHDKYYPRFGYDRAEKYGCRSSNQSGQ